MTLINDVIARLTHEFPEFQPMLAERSRNENLGELLPLVVLTDMADWAVEQPGSNLPRVTQLLATLEREYAQADEVTREFIGAGFIEQLPSRTEPGGQIVNQLGPLLAEVATWLDQSR